MIEISIVLVIIGLLTAGVLVGQDMISGAAIRSQISQLDRYKTATNTFQEKYGALPGDIGATKATQFGFAARGTCAGEGDENGLIEGIQSSACGYNYGLLQGAGETAMFWVDLSQAKLIDGTFNTASSSATPGYDVWSFGGLQKYMPTAKLADSILLVYVYSANGANYFGLSAPYEIQNSPCTSCLGSNTGVRVVQAANIDRKIDDGMPQSGNVTAQYIYFYNLSWAGATGTPLTAGSSTTCYDNNSTAGAPQHYSMGQNGGSGMNCALSFQF